MLCREARLGSVGLPKHALVFVTDIRGAPNIFFRPEARATGQRCHASASPKNKSKTKRKVRKMGVCSSGTIKITLGHCQTRLVLSSPGRVDQRKGCEEITMHTRHKEQKTRKRMRSSDDNPPKENACFSHTSEGPEKVWWECTATIIRALRGLGTTPGKCWTSETCVGIT